MNNKEFDDIIKKKLESLNTDGSENAWELFKEKWDNTSGLDSNGSDLSSEDKELDEKIKTDMQKLRVPFNSKHWIILKEQLELEALFKKKLFVAKSVELLILAFLVLGILNLWPIQKDIYQVPTFDIPMVASVPVDQVTAEKHQLHEENLRAEQKVFNDKIVSTTQDVVRKALQSVEILSNETFSLIKVVDTKEINSGNSTENKEIDPSTNNSSIQFPFIDNSDNNAHQIESVIPLVVNYSKGPIASLSQKNIEPLEIPNHPLGFPILVVDNESAENFNNTYFSFALGPKMNLINSPFDPVYEIDPYNTVNTNFNISAKIAKEVGPVELFAGLGYTNTSYAPRLVDEIYEPEPLESLFNVASLENIKFKTFNLPVGVKYNIVESNKYEFYVATGLDLNIIADSEYVIEDKPIGRYPPASAAPSRDKPVNSNSKLSQKEFNKGILRGGSLKDNLYASASVSLGLNWKVSDNSGIFIEPRYSHFISSKGIGPNEDKVHSLSIDIGARYLIN